MLERKVKVTREREEVDFTGENHSLCVFYRFLFYFFLSFSSSLLLSFSPSLAINISSPIPSLSFLFRTAFHLPSQLSWEDALSLTNKPSLHLNSSLIWSGMSTTVPLDVPSIYFKLSFLLYSLLSDGKEAKKMAH